LAGFVQVDELVRPWDTPEAIAVHDSDEQDEEELWIRGVSNGSPEARADGRDEPGRGGPHGRQ
ncbi:MAG: hypothetical protein AAB328_13990, partial [candidate division NC10 bacterium]